MLTTGVEDGFFIEVILEVGVHGCSWKNFLFCFFILFYYVFSSSFLRYVGEIVPSTVE